MEKSINDFTITASFIECPAAYQQDLSVNVAAPIFVKKIHIDEKVVSAKLIIAALGNGHCKINFKPLPAVLLTAQSNYLKTIWYDQFDVTSMLKCGENVLTVEVGNGFYNDFIDSPWKFNNALWRDKLKTIFEIHLQLESGKKQVVLSDDSVQVINSEVTFNSIRSGEYHDANLTVDEKSLDERLENAGYAKISTNIFAALRKNPVRPIIECESLKPKKIIKNSDDNYLVEFEKNISGYVELKINSTKDNVVTVVYGECATNNKVDQTNINCYVGSELFQTDKIICSNDEYIFKPRHTYHGFKFVEINGLDRLGIDDIKGIFIHQNIEQTANFSCDNELLNKIYTAAINSSYCNMHGVITDCPSREKLGWLGDLQLSAEQLLTNFDCVDFFKKIMQDIADAQSYSGQLPGIVPTAGWGFAWGNGPTFDCAIIELPYQIYRYCGDLSVFAQYYNNINKYLFYLESRLNADGLLEIGLGDWSGTANSQIDIATPLAATDTLYFMYFLSVTEKLCKKLNIDASYYNQLFIKLKNSFDKKFIVNNMCVVNHQSLLAFLISLDFHDKVILNNVAKQLEQRVIQCNNHHECGIIGARHILHSLTKSNNFNAAYKVMTQVSYPSWGKWIIDGNTSLAETWNDSMSKNHHMFSDIASFMLKSIAGINVWFDNKWNISIEPNGFEHLSFARASQKYIFGEIAINWFLQNSKLHLCLKIPNKMDFSLNVANYEIIGKNIQGDVFTYELAKRS